MTSALFAAVVVYFTGHVVVARPEAKALPVVAFTPAGAMHEPVLLIRADSLKLFEPHDSGVKLRAAHTPKGEPAFEISLAGWDVLVGSEAKPTLEAPCGEWEPLTATRLAPQLAATLVPLQDTITDTEAAPAGVSARIFLRHAGKLQATAPTLGYEDMTWKCDTSAMGCTYTNGRLTDHLRWTSDDDPEDVTFRHHKAATGPEVTPPTITFRDYYPTQLWFMTKMTVNSTYEPSFGTAPTAPHVPGYGYSLLAAQPLPTIISNSILHDIKPIFCPPIMVFRGDGK
jgi:hypothetical protein